MLHIRQSNLLPDYTMLEFCYAPLDIRKFELNFCLIKDSNQFRLMLNQKGLFLSPIDLVFPFAQSVMNLKIAR